MTSLRFVDVPELEAAVGSAWAQSDWIPITQELVDGFARLTNDRQWIHIDVERAMCESPFGTTIAHGFLTLSMLSGMIASCVTHPPAKLTLNYGFDRVRFVSPVPVGSEIRGHFTPRTVKRRDDVVDVGWDVEVHLRGSDRPAVAARWLSRLVGPV